ncbi:AraC family transcriptional regulator [Streptomyces sp. NPDC050738]|uniref:AraC family transcriptional regulator n=1 Tax=Streptomyces sp. NPDC050738 TaxID=3154744 RepID=UPI00343ADB3C
MSYPFSLRTTDVDVALSTIREGFYASFLDVLGPTTSFEARYDIADLGALTVGELTSGTDLRVRSGELGSFHVNIALTGHFAWRQGRRTEEVADPARAAVYQPVGDCGVEFWSGDCRMLAVKIESAALQRRLEAMLGHPLRQPLQLASGLDISQGPGSSWVRLVRRMFHEAGEGDGLLQHPLMAAQVEETLLTGLLLAVDHPYHEELTAPATGVRPAPVKRAMDAMEERPEHPFTTTELAAIAQVSVRWLQEAFRRYAGTTPLGHLRDVRLARVHEELRRADPAGLTVGEVAWRWGFTHLGRFAARYRARYGESPSRTLRYPDCARAERIAGPPRRP